MVNPAGAIPYVLASCIFFSVVMGLSCFMRTTAEATLSRGFSLLSVGMGVLALPGLLAAAGLDAPSALWGTLAAAPLALGPLLYRYSGAYHGLLTADDGAAPWQYAVVPLAAVAAAVLDLAGFLSRERLSAILMILLVVHTGAYLCAALNRVIKTLGRRGGGIGQAVPLLAMTLVYGLALVAVAAAELPGGAVSPGARIMAALVPVAHFLASQRFPQLAGVFTRGLSRGRPVTGQLRTAGADADPLGARLMELMEKERIYRYEDLNVAMLAGALEVQPYLLSQYINGQLGQSFSVFVNAYRVREAKSRLIHEPDASILSIAFDVGFSSKASFNRVFKDMTSFSPTEYRSFFVSLSKEQFY